MKLFLVATMASLLASTAFAKPLTYTLDPTHTYPSFEADHKGGLSKWRGKIDKSSGTVIYDAEAKTGSVDVLLQIDSIDFGFGPMNTHAKGPDILDAAQFPTASYTGKLVFKGANVVAVDGNLTLHGVTKPVRLDVKSWKCITNPKNNSETCGADAYATFNRGDFGVDFGKDRGFNLDTALAIQVEGVRQDESK